jgi:hypothetical protein
LAGGELSALQKKMQDEKYIPFLYVDEKTGCSEISMDMNNPMILYAAMWEHGRLPWKVISGGPGSGRNLRHNYRGQPDVPLQALPTGHLLLDCLPTRDGQGSRDRGFQTWNLEGGCARVTGQATTSHWRRPDECPTVVQEPLDGS